MRPEVLAEAVAHVLAEAMLPVASRLATVEDHRGRHEHVLESLTTLCADLRERMAALETRPPVPGPAGPAGPPGQDGVNGKDGTPGLRYCGVYVSGKTYELGDLVTWDGSTWHCHDTTTSKPGEGATHWRLMVKRGRDGKDIRP